MVADVARVVTTTVSTRKPPDMWDHGGLSVSQDRHELGPIQ